MDRRGCPRWSTPTRYRQSRTPAEQSDALHASCAHFTRTLFLLFDAFVNQECETLSRIVPTSLKQTSLWLIATCPHVEFMTLFQLTLIFWSPSRTARGPDEIEKSLKRIILPRHLRIIGLDTQAVETNQHPDYPKGAPVGALVCLPLMPRSAWNLASHLSKDRFYGKADIE